MHSCFHAQDKIVKYLLDSGADPNLHSSMYNIQIYSFADFMLTIWYIFIMFKHRHQCEYTKLYVFFYKVICNYVVISTLLSPGIRFVCDSLIHHQVPLRGTGLCIDCSHPYRIKLTSMLGKCRLGWATVIQTCRRHNERHVVTTIGIDCLM